MVKPHWWWPSAFGTFIALLLVIDFSAKDGDTLADLFSPPLVWRTLFVVLGTVVGSNLCYYVLGLLTERDDE
jgi:hypothetical protein